MMKNLDLGRKIRIVLGTLLIIISAFTGGGLVLAGMFIALTGIFNLCPTCVNGACEINPEDKKDSNRSSD